jgi:hypothetical protein
MDQNPTIGRRTLLTAGGAVALAALAGCTARGLPFGVADYAEEERHSFPASEVATLAVDSAVGNVVVGTAATDRVEVTVVERAEERATLRDIVADAELVDGSLTVRTRTPARRLTSVDETPRVDVWVTFPAPGPVVESLTTRAGEVTLRDARGDATLHAGVGAVLAERVDGFLTLSSGLGRVEATDVTGIDRAVTDVGEVTVEVRDLRTDAEVGTEWGEATVAVHEDLDVDVLAEANGAVDCDLPLTSRTGGGRLVAGRLNRGGHRLRVYSELGEVSVRRLAA